MRPMTLVSAAAFVLGATAAFAQTPTPLTALPSLAPLQLEVALRGYGTDDHARSLAGDSASDKLDSYVWADRSLCAMGAGDSAPTTTPWIGWHFIATVTGIVSEAGRNAVVFRVEWQRMWENGARVTEGTKGTASASLRDGERQELDRVTASGPAGACGTANARLEVGVVARPAYLARRVQDLLAGAQAGARGAAGNFPIVPKNRIAGDYAELAKQFKAQGLLASPGSYDAELWLVHRHPDGTESTELHQTIRFTGADVAFTFPAVVVNTSKGDLTLDFSGTLRAGVGPDANSFPGFWLRGYPGPAGDPAHSFTITNGADYWLRAKSGDAAADNAVRIAVTIARRIRGGTPALDSRGGSYFFMDVPAPTDVVSFEFPSMPNVSPDLLKGHTFSLRLRIAPVAK